MRQKSNQNPKIRKAEQIIVRVNPKIYPLDVIYSAAYVLLDDYYIILDGDPKKEVVVKLSPKNSSDLKDIEKKFHNELICYAFYKKQVEKNGEMRNLILQRALLTADFSGAHDNLVNRSKENIGEGFEDLDDEYINDPEGIAIPWEEKFGKKSKTVKKKKR
jgi:His-Xaa-Ser system protein HxsD